MNFKQETVVRNYNAVPRFQLFEAFCHDKKVLHIGCADYPFRKEWNLHLYLYDKCQLDGVDTSLEGLEILEEHGVHPKTLANNMQFFEENTYDVVLVPEVIEHVTNLDGFFDRLKKVNTSHYVITAPCAIQCTRKKDITEDIDKHQAFVTEIVHPEHLCWYSPYTLKSTIQAHTDWEVETMFWFNGISVGAVCRK